MPKNVFFRKRDKAELIVMRFYLPKARALAIKQICVTLGITISEYFERLLRKEK